MSYLVTPQRPLHAPVEVPCIATYDYDGGPLPTFPERKGFGDKTLAEWNSLFRSPSQEFKSFLQTWLFFGLINQAMLPSPPPQSITLGNLTAPGESYVTIIDTKKFRDMVQNWLALRNAPDAQHPHSVRIRNDLTKNAIVHVVSIINCLERHNQNQVGLEGNHHCCSLFAYLSNMPVVNPLLPEITMSINLLLDILYAAIQLDPEMSQLRHRAVSTFKTNRLARWSSPIPVRMREDGWCPYQISMLHERLNAAGLCFASDFDRPSSHVEHRTIQERKTPELDLNSKAQVTNFCSHYRCAETVLNPDEYKRKHTEDCQGHCKDMIADRTQIHDILLNKRTFPLVLLIDEENSEDEVNLCEFEEGLPYVAISHVWSDGLGNLGRNALPRCQMLRISRYVRNLDQGENTNGIMLFWIDTLCIPPDPINKDDEARNAQEVAITFMRQTYEEARAVLVLDSWLATQSVGHCTPTEILMRVLSSNWNTRLWTLQEGALAKLLLFQFADLAFDSDDRITAMIHDSHDVSAVTLHTTIVQCFEDIRSLAWDGMETPNLIALMHAFKVRSTSVASDEALCLAALMKLDLAEITKTRHDERMITFWSLLKDVPRSIIFYTGIKLQKPGYRWAPRSFLRPNSRSEDVRANLPVHAQHREVTGKVTPFGLEVEYPGLDLHISWEGPWFGMIFFCTEANEYFEGNLPNLNIPEHMPNLFHDDHAPYVKMMPGAGAGGGHAIEYDSSGLLRASGASPKFVDGRMVRVLYIILQDSEAFEYEYFSGLLACPIPRQTRKDVVSVRGICRMNIKRIGTEEQFVQLVSQMLDRPMGGLKRVKEGFQAVDGSGFIAIARSVRRNSQVWTVD